MIEKTILSVLGQKYRDFEYIVIDGGSTDGTLQILEKYASQDKLKFVSEPDNGMYDAINKGLLIANGEILAYLNTDDLYFPWTLTCVAEYFKANPTVDMVFGDTLVRDENQGRRLVNIYPSFCRNWLLSGAIIPQPTVFFRRKVFDKLGDFADRVQILGDCEYWLRAISGGFKIRKISEFLAVEYNHPGTLRSKFQERIDNEKRQMVRKYARGRHRSKVARRYLLRKKYVEKEILTLWFAVKCTLSNRRGAWRNCLKEYNFEFHPAFYLTEKILKEKAKRVWEFEAKASLNGGKVG
jgi:glycosyltransferase involved in cell wall biosynthesis